MNFDLYLPVEVIFGVGSVNKVGEVGRRFGYRVLIATGKKSTKEEKQEVFRDILSLKSQAILTRYIEYLEKNSKIKINKELLGGG